ncbi:MAG TPA: aldehyde dehydrogenase family protein [Cytophagaceae bacterium]
MQIEKEILSLLKKLGIGETNSSYSTGRVYADVMQEMDKKIYSPIDSRLLGSVSYAGKTEYEIVLNKAIEAFELWRNIPAPQRGEVVRQIGVKLRENKEALGMLVTLETGKILQEGQGEVQEMIDICDYATGLSRQLHGFTMHSERPEHRMYEQYHPLGVVAIISAFNFPVAVWSWNAMVAAVCGNVCIWKPSEKTPLTAIACQKIIEEVLEKNGVPEGVFSYIIGDYKIGELMSKDVRIPLVSATGSTRMGKLVNQNVAARLGKSLLELGGNNAIIITENANLDIAIRATVFGAVGTGGQRCTTTRRLIVHEKVYDEVLQRLSATYKKLPIGNPLQENNLVGPLIDKDAVKSFFTAIERLKSEGGKIITGGERLTTGELAKGNYVMPVLAEAENHYLIVQEETFAPILYVIKYSGEVSNAIKIQNDVKQGLSSAIFSNNIIETETFLSHQGSDCGIANVNIGTSGAEIGGAFGGEKETGGGRESGSDSWKAYMRRQTNTINYSKKLPLAQGIRFDV